MIFRIKSEAFIRGDNAQNTIALRLKSTERQLFIKETAASLLDCNQPTDFDIFIHSFDDDKKRDFIDALTLLDCFDLVEKYEETVACPDEIYIAGERDYRAISKFIITNAASPYSFSPIRSDEYFSEDNVRARQFNNKEYHFVLKKENEIIAVLIIGVPSFSDIFSVAALRALFLSSRLTKDECSESIIRLVDFAKDKFAGEFSKLRFSCTQSCTAPFIELFPALDFKKICVLEKELLKTENIVIYDKKFD